MVLQGKVPIILKLLETNALLATIMMTVIKHNAVDKVIDGTVYIFVNS